MKIKKRAVLASLVVGGLFLLLFAILLPATTGFTTFQIFNDAYIPASHDLRVEMGGGPINLKATAVGSSTDVTFSVAATSVVSNVTIGFTSQHVSFLDRGPGPDCFVKLAAGATTSDNPVGLNQSFDADIATGTVSVICAAAETATFAVYARGPN